MTHRYITVAYDLYADNAAGIHEVLEQATAEYPFQFITNLGMTLDSFEAQVGQLNEGDAFDFTLSVDEAYGPYEEEHVIEVPKEAFHINGRFDKEQIYPGNIIPLVNEDGYHFDGLVVEVKDAVVVIDLNHPLAGKALHYKGRVVTARDATLQEVQGAVNRMSGEEGCSCGCGHEPGGHEGGCCGGHGEKGGCGCGHQH